jgi:hypothetical protein
MMHEVMPHEAKLTLGGVYLPEDQDPLGIWGVGSHEAVAFAAGARFEGPVWRVELSESARTSLRAQREAVRTSDRDLDRIAYRMAHLDLATSYATPVAGAEAELRAAIAALSSPAMAFDTRAEERLNYRELYSQCQALLAQFQMLVRPVARVETLMGGRLVGLTAIDWSGDHRTIWMEDSVPDQMEAHLATVRLALASRQVLLRLFGVVVTGAVGIAVKAHIPGGQILLLPAVYRFVRDVLQELKRLPEGLRVR